MNPTLLRILGFTVFLAAVTIPLRYALGQGLSLTVTPPLFQLTIGPGENWSSSIKVVNTNEYPVTYYARVVDFNAEGEGGKSTFTPLIEGTDNSDTLAGWVTLGAKPITIPAGESAPVPFAVSIPDNAAPGGHYAAILIGTEPGLDPVTGPSMKVSSFVSSLLFVRVKGDVHESGRIREFVTQESLYGTTKADFVLRFENTGNTHLKPQGEVVIYNMWGKERGKVLINQKNSFGNVLPESVRRFEFGWEGALDIFDIGRYKAEVTLSYGDEARQNTSASAYFWVVPFVPVASVGGGLLVLIVSLIWFIRRYIRRALALEQARLGLVAPRSPSFSTFLEPLREGVVDLRTATGGVVTTSRTTTDDFTFGTFVKKYKSFFVFLATVVVFFVVLMAFFRSVFTSSRPYEVNEVQTGEEWSEV